MGVDGLDTAMRADALARRASCVGHGCTHAHPVRNGSVASGISTECRGVRPSGRHSGSGSCVGGSGSNANQFTIARLPEPDARVPSSLRGAIALVSDPVVH